ncbi:MAG: phosphotransferase [Catenulispora sp.]|nr:phosphotransferase [Catenulispora sp.]
MTAQDVRSEPDDGLAAHLEQQIAAVDRRVLQGGDVYAEERAEIRLAVRRAVELQRLLDLGPLTAALTPRTGKPQVLLGFRDTEWGPVVLKVYGAARPWEAETQRLWAGIGVRTPAIHAAGDDPQSWLLLEWLSGAAVAAAETAGTDGLIRVTAELAEIMSVAHSLEPSLLTSARPLVTTIGRHLSIVVGALVRHGYQPPRDWQAAADGLFGADPPAVLHGDLARGNMIRDQAGRLWVFDASGVLGPAEFDAARWCARTGGPEHARSALEAWLSAAGGRLDAVRAGRLLGLELLMEAGGRELVKDERGLPSDEIDAVTLACLDEARQLLALR